MDKTVFGLGSFPRINEEDFKNFYEDFFRKHFGVSYDKENKEEKDEKPEEKDSDTRIYNVIHDGELYFVRGDRFEYTEDGYMLSIFNGDTKVAVFQGHPSIIDESYFFGTEEDEE